ncbi:replication protein A 14 kDa subunit B-like [Cornus florida]|uniref:replication protein A 14 kDa subunit B-like n=1 Tax=Cornus florida TaxID=4283 RepID=UPI00289E10A7|nr:replication protein A 14 kDa subunit B-like [Cornus florida]
MRSRVSTFYSTTASRPLPTHAFGNHKQVAGLLLPINFTATPASFRPDRNFVEDMDTSNPAVFVNTELLRMYVGRKVRAVIQVIRSDGGVVVGKSTDEKQLMVKGSPPFPLTTFVEVIGIADSNQSIHAEVWTNFGDTFDTNNYNQLCQLANGEYKHLFI